MWRILRICADGTRHENTVRGQTLDDALKRLKASQTPPPVKPLTLHEITVSAILECIEFHEGNKSAAAKELGISLKTVYNWLHRAGIMEGVNGESR